MQDNLRPQMLDDYIGQEENKEVLKVYIESSITRNKSLSHTLIHGQAGLGKTSLASVMANECGKEIMFANAANIEKVGDLVKYLIELEDGDFLFIDEIHRLDKKVEENLYTAMEDFRVDINKNDRPISLDLNHFTLVGATTMKGKLSQPLIDRFGINIHLNPYKMEELIKIILLNVQKIGFKIDKQSAYEIAIRSRGTPRKANRIISRLYDFCVVEKIEESTIDFTKMVLNKLKVDEYGLEDIDRKILRIMQENYSDRPVGINAIASTSGESRETIELDIEPYLLQMGFIERTPRGRVITEKGNKVIESGL